MSTKFNFKFYMYTESTIKTQQLLWLPLNSDHPQRHNSDILK